MKKIILVILIAGIAAGWVFWPRPAQSHESVTTTVLFDRKIVQILNRHCVMCHVENGPSFPLETYEQTYLLRRKIRNAAIARHMSPWPAVPGYGEFSNDNSLTLREISFLVSWAEGWGPRNAGTVFTNTAVSSVVPPKAIQAHIDFSKWELGEPNFVQQLPTNTIEAQQPIEMKRSVIDPGLTSPRWLRGLEYKPGDHRVVRAAYFTIQETGQWIGSWTPWSGFMSLPKGLAYRLPARSHIIAEIYYQGSKEQVDEHGALGLFFADRPTSTVLSDVLLDANGGVSADVEPQKVRATTKLLEDTHVLALWPEIRPGLKSLEVSARTPNGGTQVILFAEDFPANWPTPYIFKQPVALPKGTELSATAYYSQTGAEPQAVGIHLTASVYQSSGTKLPVAPARPKVQTTSSRRFKLTGTVVSVNASQHSLTVQHGAIPGFMAAMTMAYETGQQEDMTKFSAGDQIKAEVVVIGTDTHLENIIVTNHHE